jgi:hypothetical protein
MKTHSEGILVKLANSFKIFGKIPKRNQYPF